MSKRTSTRRRPTEWQQAEWERASEAMSRVAARLGKIPGVISIHAQYAEPVGVLVFLVDSDEARRALYSAEVEFYRNDPDLPVEIQVEKVAPDEVGREQAALDTAYGRLSPND